MVWSLIIQKSITVDGGDKRYYVPSTAVVNHQSSGLVFIVQHAADQ